MCESKIILDMFCCLVEQVFHERLKNLRMKRQEIFFTHTFLLPAEFRIKVVSFFPDAFIIFFLVGFGPNNLLVGSV